MKWADINFSRFFFQIQIRDQGKTMTSDIEIYEPKRRQ